MPVAYLRFAKVRKLYHERCPEGQWFARDTLRRWKTKFYPHALLLNNGLILFLSQETDATGRTACTVRMLTEHGIETIGPPHFYPHFLNAMAAARQYASEVEGGLIRPHGNQGFQRL